MPIEINYSTLPDHMQEGVRQYIEKGRPIGDFLTAVFENDLVEAFGRADGINAAAMREWAKFLYNQAPAPCWGSKEKVAAWLQEGGTLGGTYGWGEGGTE